MAKKRVVITGLGALTPIGKGAPEFWNGLVSGKSGTKSIDNFDVSGFPTQFAAQIEDFDVSEYMNAKEARRLDKFCQYAMVASDEAIQDSGVNLETIDLDRVAVLIGSGIGGMQIFYKQAVDFYEKGHRGVSPFFIPMLIPDMASGQVSIKYGFRGPNYCAVSACATSSHNIGLAYDTIVQDQADYVICGGSEAPVFGMGLAGFNAVRALSTRNDSPETASRPFDKTRDGFVLGEGAGILMLESLDSAIKRGARIYGEMAGYGFSGDAHHITAPDPDGKGVMLALHSALKSAGIQPKDIDHINMHGTATPLGDIAETKSIKRVFDDHAYKMNLNSTKSMTGHMLGAAGSAESIATVLSIYHGLIPPTINYQTPDPECDLNYTTNETEAKDITYAMNNAFGFGGHNTSLVFKKYMD
ncbi:beta-ketoacyl-ACP synthase II [Balneolaceae bacterium ANBcel3]|nr:beta-ketoacyl-ACP synthase II [Balneolaceae bacterium ANBcel3]